MQHFALGEARRTEHLNVVHYVCGTSKDQVSQDLSRRRGMHHAVSAETVGTVEAAHLGNRSKNCVMVGRHLVQTCPCAFRIDGQVLEAGHTVRSEEHTSELQSL